MEAWTLLESVAWVAQRHPQLPQPLPAQHNQQRRHHQKDPFDAAAKPNPNDPFERCSAWASKIPYENCALK